MLPCGTFARSALGGVCWGINKKGRGIIGPPTNCGPIMVDIILRVLIAGFGVLLLSMGIQYLWDPAGSAAQYGLAVSEEIGLATLRADMGAFFCGSGGLALAAAALNRPAWLLAPTVLMALAFVGRVITLAVDGADPGTFVPMAVEAVMVVLFGAAMMRARTA